MARRTYRLGRRQAAVDHTAQAILGAARELVAGGSAVSMSAIARRAEVSRITVYNRFGSRAGVLQALAPSQTSPAAETPGEPREALRRRLAEACARWSTDAALYRHLPVVDDGEADRRLAGRVAAADALRPGCSIKEAEDVIGVLTSFAVFDRLHRDGRRSASAVADILERLAGGILAYHL